MPHPEYWSDEENHAVLHFPGSADNPYYILNSAMSIVGWRNKDDATIFIKKHNLKKLYGWEGMGLDEQGYEISKDAQRIGYCRSCQNEVNPTRIYDDVFLDFMATRFEIILRPSHIKHLLEICRSSDTKIDLEIIEILNTAKERQG